MKKIFTLISMALFAVGVNAQDLWSASELTFDSETKQLQGMTVTDNSSVSFIIPEEDKVFDVGTYPNNISRVTDWLASQADPSKYSTPLKEYTFTVTKGDVTLKGVSTPNSDNETGQEWQNAGGETSNLALNTEACNPKFTNYVKPKTGNPSLGYYDFYDKNESDELCHRVSDVLWTVGCGKLPAKGCFYEITFAKAGNILVGVYLGRPNSSPTVVLEKSSLTALPVSSLSFEGYCQNNTYTYLEAGYQKFNFREDYTIDVSNQPSRNLLGYLSFPVEAKTYLLFQSSNQMGIYGFSFTGGESGISTVKADNAVNAPIYNLAGQKVEKSYKGMVIQNGKKFMNK